MIEEKQAAACTDMRPQVLRKSQGWFFLNIAIFERLITALLQ